MVVSEVGIWKEHWVLSNKFSKPVQINIIKYEKQQDLNFMTETLCLIELSRILLY